MSKCCFAGNLRVTFLFLFSSPGLCMYGCNRISASASGNYRLRHHPEIRERTCLIVISGTAALADPVSADHFAGNFGTLTQAFAKKSQETDFVNYQHYPVSQSSLRLKTRM